MIKHLLSKTINIASLGHIKFGWWSSPFTSSVSPIIIAGAPRTGSTLLRTMLDNHPSIWIGPENGVFQEGGSNLSGMVACTGLSQNVIRELHRKSTCLGEFIDALMACGLQEARKSRWGIKSPSIVLNMSNVFRYFPKTQFVHILRDGRDVICSLRDHPKYHLVNGIRQETGIVNPWEHCISRWRESTREGLQWRSDPRYYEVKYEDLIVDPAFTLRSLLQWLGHDFDESILDFYTRETNEGIDTPHPGVKKPVYGSTIGRWKQDLPADALRLLTDNDYRLISECGYDID